MLKEIYSKMLSNRLIFQGLSDTEEFVVIKALNALTSLAELGLLQKPALQELVSCSLSLSSCKFHNIIV